MLSVLIIFLGCKSSKNDSIIEPENNEEQVEIKVEHHEYEYKYKNEKDMKTIFEKLLDYGEHNHRHNYSDYQKSFSVANETDILFLQKFTQDELLEFIEELYIYPSMTDLKFLENFPQLKRLRIWFGEMDDIDALKFLQNIETLVFDGIKKHIDLSPITSLKNLKNLYLNYSEIGDLSPLSELKNLELLSFHADCETEETYHIFNLTGLKNLKLGGLIVDLTFIERLQQLEYLQLFSISQNDLNNLSSLKQLKELDIWGESTFYDVSPLLELPNLEKIDFPRNFYINILPLASINSLKEIRMDFGPERWYNFQDNEGVLFEGKGIYVRPYDWR
jgi:hypothetical protein